MMMLKLPLNLAHKVRTNRAHTHPPYRGGVGLCSECVTYTTHLVVVLDPEVLL
jgi:hypothetical protein